MAQEQQQGINKRQILGVTAVVLLILIFFFALVDVDAVIAQLRTADWRYLAAGSASLMAGMLVYAVRWRLLLNEKPSPALTFHAANIGHAGNIIIPARGGELLRIVVVGADETTTLTETTSSFVVERLFEQMMRALALLTAVAIGVGLQVNVWTPVGSVGVVLLAFGGIFWVVNHREAVLAKGPALLARLPRLTEEEAHASLADLLDNLTAVASLRRLSLVIFWSLLAWGFFWGFFFLTLLSLENGFPPTEWLPVSLGALALSPPSAPTQPGIFHASVVAPLTAVGFDPPTLTAYAVLLHILEMVWMIGLGLIGVWRIDVSLRDLFSNRNSQSANG